MANIFNDSIEGVQGLILVVKQLNKDLKLVIKTNSEIAKSFNFNKIKDIEKLEKSIKDVTKAEKELVKVKETEIKLEKQLTLLTDEEVKSKLKHSDATAKQKATLKDLIILEDKEAGTLKKVEAISRKLRRERDSLNLETKKGQKRLIEINKELDKNNKLVKENSDKLKQQKLNVGNYTESIQDAIIGNNKLAIGIQSVTGKAGGMTTAFAAVAGLLYTIYTRTQENKDQFSDIIAVIRNLGDSLLDRLVSVGRGVSMIFSSMVAGISEIPTKIAIIGQNIKLTLIESFNFSIPKNKLFDEIKFGLDGTGEKAKEINKEIKRLESTLSSGTVAKGWDMITSSFDGLIDEMKAEIEISERLNGARRTLLRDQKLFTAEESRSKANLSARMEFVKNELNDARERLKVFQQINKEEDLIFDKKLKLAERDLALSLDQLNLTGEQADLVEKIKNGQIDSAEAIRLAEKFTLKSAAGEESLFNIIEKIVALENVKSEIAEDAITDLKLEKKLRHEILKLETDALEKRAKVEEENSKTLSKNANERFNSAIENERLLTESLKLQLKAEVILRESYDAQIISLALSTQNQIEEIQSQANKSEQDILQFRKDREVTLSQEKIDNAQYVQEQLLNNEELTTQQQLDITKDSNDEIIDAIYKRQQAEIESESLKNAILLENTDLNSDDKIKIEEEEAETIRLINLKASNEIRDIKDNERDLELKAQKETNEKAIALQKEHSQMVRDTFAKLLDKQAEMQEKSISEAEKLLEKQQEKEDEQRRRAENGLENNLQFEQEARAKREKALIEEQKKLEKIQKIQTYFETYNANLSALKDGEQSSLAISRTIRDMAILEAITKFEDGGIIEDKLPQDGIFKGRSHKQGGIKVEVEGSEGIFSKKEMNNLGKENFYKLKKMAKENKLNDLMQVQAVPYMNGYVSIQNEIKELNRTIKNIEIQKVDVHRFAKDILLVNETLIKGNKKTNNKHYISR